MAENILSSLKPLHHLLKIFGLLNFDIDKGIIYETNSNYYGYIIVDVVLMIATISSGAIINMYDREFARLVLNMFLVLVVVKFVGVNIRRLVYGKSMAGLWQSLRNLEIDFIGIGIKLEFTYIPVLGYSLTIFFVGIRIIGLVVRKVYFDNDNIYESILFNVTAVKDLPLVATKVEYMVYLLIFQQYFKKLSKPLQISFQNGNGFHNRILQKKYTTLCDSIDDILRMLTSSLIVITAECLYILTFGFHGGLSRIYNSENTKFWFFDIKYAVVWGLEHSLGLLSILIPSYVCHKEVGDIRCAESFLYWNIHNLL